MRTPCSQPRRGDFGGGYVSEERRFAGVGESSHAARDSVEAGQAEDGVLSCWRSANPNDETERQLPDPQRAVGNGLFRGYSKNRDKREYSVGQHRWRGLDQPRHLSI